VGMRTIPTTFNQAGYTLDLVKRTPKAAMYADANRSYFEVHRVRVRPAELAFGKELPEREVLSSNEDFGRHAWACVTRDRAEARFADLL
jgi:hypothetical protein